MINIKEMMEKKNAQGAIEFMIIFSAFLLFFVVLFSVIKMNIEDKNLEKERTIARNIALDVQYELNLASDASEGYYREFEIPNTIFGKDYEINNTNNEVYVSVNSMTITYKIIPLNGYVQKGLNIIQKQNGTVLLN